MRTNTEESLSLLRKWRDEKTLLHCSCVAGVILGSEVRGRIETATEKELRICSDDNTATVYLFLPKVKHSGFWDLESNFAKLEQLPVGAPRLMLMLDGYASLTLTEIEDPP